MDLTTLLSNGGHAQRHAQKAIQETGAALMSFCPNQVTTLSIGEADSNDWSLGLTMLCDGHNVAAWIECTSDGVNRPGEYRFRALATIDSIPVDLGFNDPPWISGENEAGIDALIAQLTSIELSVIAISKALEMAMHP